MFCGESFTDTAAGGEKKKTYMTESEWDKLLEIKTSGRDDSHADDYRYPYEPTSYDVLERLANSGYIKKKNTLLDYGCGKGRVSLFMAYQTKCRSIGIEYDERIYERAITNKEGSLSGSRVEFLCTDAKNYEVPAMVDRIFFFNPFSVEILKSVLVKIYESYYDNPREILLMFYYPSDDYIACLIQEGEIDFEDEIDMRDLFGSGKDERERIMIFKLP